jgi:putative SOS response-associated peptidase YedK
MSPSRRLPNNATLRQIIRGRTCFNARAETVATKPPVRSTFKARRCLVPASGYYEWQPRPDGKQPYYFTASDDLLMAFAGLWDSWRPTEGGDQVLTYTIIVGGAAPSSCDIHDRMPTMLDRPDRNRRLDGQDTAELLRPAPEGALKRHPVSRAFNSPKNHGRNLIEPVQL